MSKGHWFAKGFAVLIGGLVLVNGLVLLILFGPLKLSFGLAGQKGADFFPSQQTPLPVQQAFAELRDPFDFRSEFQGVRGQVVGLLLEARSRKLSDDSEKALIFLNMADFGEGIRGIEAASQYYFKKSADQLTLYEAQALAAAYRAFR